MVVHNVIIPVPISRGPPEVLGEQRWLMSRWSAQLSGVARDLASMSAGNAFSGSMYRVASGISISKSRGFHK